MSLVWIGEASSKSTEQLLEFVSDPPFSRIKALEAARSELKKRGVELPSLRIGGLAPFVLFHGIRGMG